MSLKGIMGNAVLAMQAQSHHMGTISGNITNVTTTSYKRAETRFETLLSEVENGREFYSAQAKDYRRVTEQGPLNATGRTLDLAMNGRGFFVVNTSFGGDGQTYYTRDGSFTGVGVPAPGVDTSQPGYDQESYLVSNEGYYLMGYEALEDGTFSNQLGPIRNDQTTVVDGFPTTAIEIDGNIDGSDGVENQSIGLGIFDNSYQGRNLSLNFARNEAPNSWTLNFNLEGGTVVSPAADAQTVQFTGNARVEDPPQLDLEIAWDDGTTGNITLDISDLTAFAGDQTIKTIDQNGAAEGRLQKITINDDGILVGEFSNGITQNMAKIAVADFINADALELSNGNLYRYRNEAGEIEMIDLETDRRADIMSGMLEFSNVRLEDEFSRMIITQQAYTSAAQVFRTGDEMLQEAGTLKA